MWLTADTHVGQKRENNQDAFLIQKQSEGGCYAIVCDGMGGEQGGAVASELAAKTMAGQLARDLRTGMGELSVRRVLQCAAAAANAEVRDAAAADPTLSGMGTTLVAAVVTPTDAHLVHAGDSRAYLLRDDLLTQLTTDHTVVQMLLDRGSITAQAARTHPKRHYITRAVGVEKETRFDVFSISLEAGDVLLLCTDGLYNFMSPEDLSALTSICAKRRSVAPLIDRANENGGGDNITAALIGVTGGGDAMHG